MTTSIVLQAKEGSSLTEAYNALTLGYPEVFKDLKDSMKGEVGPGVFAGSGDYDYQRLQIDLKHLPPECIEELRPIFTLLRRVIEAYSEDQIVGAIVVTEGEVETKYDF